MEKFLIMKLDEDLLMHFPERLSDVPLPLITDIPDGEMQVYQQIVIRGDGCDIETLRAILFPAETDHKVYFKYCRIRDEAEQVALREKFQFLKQFDHDPGREIRTNKPSAEGAGNNS